MIGMNFISFIILLAIAVVVAIILHFVFNYKIREKWSSIFGEIIFAWIGGWLGSPVIGHWFHGFGYMGSVPVYIIPAILGALALLVIAVECSKSLYATKKE